MPLTSAGLSGSIIAGLTSAGMLGERVPQLASGIATGLVNWVRTLVVTTADTGTAGSGTGFIPWVFLAPVFIPNLLTAYSSNQLLGLFAPSEATGLGNGICTGFLQGALVTQHPQIGTGTGLCKIIWTPAFPFLMAGFSSAGIVGPSAWRKANAISQALDASLAVFILPTPIVGSATPTASSGVGFGIII